MEQCTCISVIIMYVQQYNIYMYVGMYVYTYTCSIPTHYQKTTYVHLFNTYDSIIICMLTLQPDDSKPSLASLGTQMANNNYIPLIGSPYNIRYGTQIHAVVKLAIHLLS